MRTLERISPTAKTKRYTSALTSDLDLRTEGGMAQGAKRVIAGTAGTLALQNASDGSWVDVECAQHVAKEGNFIRMAWGTQAQHDSGAGTYPGTLSGGETITIRLDEGTIFDTGNVVVTLAATDVTQALFIAAVNARLNELFPEPGGHPPRVYAADEGSDVTSITGRARGSGAKVEIVAVDAAVATMTGFTVGSTGGAQFVSPAAAIEVSW